MKTSQTRKIFTFSTNARAMSGNELEMSPQSKNVRFTSGQPADWVTATITTVTKTAVLRSAIATPARALAFEAEPAEQARAALYFRIGAPVAFASHFC